MKKALFSGARDLKIVETDLPAPGAGEVRVKVKYCGICGSDKHEYLHGAFPESPFGHEVVGTVDAVGPGVTKLREGDRVIGFFSGGFSEYLVIPEGFTLEIPENMNWEQAALLEPFAGAAYTLKKGSLAKEDSLLITGAGTVGIMVLIAAQKSGAGPIYISDPSAFNRDRALKLGATAAFDPTTTKIPKEIRSLTDGNGIDVSVEAVGILPSLKDCLASTRFQGTAMIQGIFTESVPLNMLAFVTREITMIGANSIDPQQALEWMSDGAFPTEDIITATISLEEIVHAGFEAPHPEQHIKILVAP